MLFRSKVGVATAGAMVWNFTGILAGPAIFAACVRVSGSYTQTFAWLTVLAACGLVMLVKARRAAV